MILIIMECLYLTLGMETQALFPDLQIGILKIYK